MHINILERNDRVLRFVLEGGSAQLANALRRIAMSEVPVLAIDSVDFYANDTAMYDEVLAHRLGMVPLWFDKKAFNRRDECKCEGKGCSNCQIVLVLNKKGPGVALSGDFKSADKDAAKPLIDDIPMVEMLEGEQVKAEATARLGTGAEHAKWSAARAWYMGWPQIVDGKGELLVEPCAEHALQMDGGIILPDKAYGDGKCKVKGEIGAGAKITNDNSRIIFTIESVSGLKAEEVLAQALGILKDKAREFGKQAGAL